MNSAVEIEMLVLLLLVVLLLNTFLCYSLETFPAQVGFLIPSNLVTSPADMVPWTTLHDHYFSDLQTGANKSPRNHTTQTFCSDSLNLWFADACR